MREREVSLTLGHALNAAPIDLGEVAGVVDNKGDGRGHKATGLAAAPDVVLEHHAGKVVKDQQLDHQRRAPHHPDDEAAQQAQRLEAGAGAKGDDEAQRDRADQRHKKQLQGLEKAHIQSIDDDGELLLYQFHELTLRILKTGKNRERDAPSVFADPISVS